MGDGEDDGEPTWASIGEDRRGAAQAPTAKGSGGDAPTQPTPSDAHSPPLKEWLPDVPKSGWEGGALTAGAGWTPGGPGLVAAGVDLGVAAGVDLGVAAGVDLGVAAGVDLGSAAGVDLGSAAGMDLGSAAGVDLGSAAGVDLGSAGVDLSSAGLDLTLA